MDEHLAPFIEQRMEAIGKFGPRTGLDIRHAEIADGERVDGYSALLERELQARAPQSVHFGGFRKANGTGRAPSMDRRHIRAKRT
jgi:hypothetical protein